MCIFFRSRWSSSSSPSFTSCDDALSSFQILGRDDATNLNDFRGGHRSRENSNELKDRPEYRSKPAPFSLRADGVAPTGVKTMSEKNIGSVVIVDDEMQVKRIVTARDLMPGLLNKSLDPKMTLLSSIMTAEVRTGRADDEVIDWLRQMSNERSRPRSISSCEPLPLSSGAGSRKRFAWHSIPARLIWARVIHQRRTGVIQAVSN